MESNQDMPNLIKFLQNDGYVFEEIDFDPRFGGSARAIFNKMAHIEEINGNDVNDASISVTVDFSTNFDYKRGVENDGVVEYPDYSREAGEIFIRKLLDKTYGRGKIKVRKSRRKTHKNRRR